LKSIGDKRGLQLQMETPSKNGLMAEKYVPILTSGQCYEWFSRCFWPPWGSFLKIRLCYGLILMYIVFWAKIATVFAIKNQKIFVLQIFADFSPPGNPSVAGHAAEAEAQGRGRVRELDEDRHRQRWQVQAQAVPAGVQKVVPGSGFVLHFNFNFLICLIISIFAHNWKIAQKICFIGKLFDKSLPDFWHGSLENFDHCYDKIIFWGKNGKIIDNFYFNRNILCFSKITYFSWKRQNLCQKTTKETNIDRRRKSLSVELSNQEISPKVCFPQICKLYKNWLQLLIYFFGGGG
jgi:hypothetical protein